MEHASKVSANAFLINTYERAKLFVRKVLSFRPTSGGERETY